MIIAFAILSVAFHMVSYIIINYHYGAVILLCHSFIIFVQYLERVFSPDYTVAQGNDINRDVGFLELFDLPYDTVAERCEYEHVGKLGITSKEWAKLGVPLGVVIMVVYYVYCSY